MKKKINKRIGSKKQKTKKQLKKNSEQIILIEKTKVNKEMMLTNWLTLQRKNSGLL